MYEFTAYFWTDTTTSKINSLYIKDYADQSTADTAKAKLADAVLVSNAYTTEVAGALTTSIISRITLTISNLNTYCAFLITEYPAILELTASNYPVTDTETGVCWVIKGLTRMAGAPLKCSYVAATGDVIFTIYNF